MTSDSCEYFECLKISVTKAYCFGSSSETNLLSSEVNWYVSRPFPSSDLTKRFLIKACCSLFKGLQGLSFIFPPHINASTAKILEKFDKLSILSLIN